MAELFDFDMQWRRLVNKVIGDGYGTLSAEEKVWYNAQCLHLAIGDGGLISYYYNSFAERLDDCLAALDSLGLTELKGLMLQMNAFFPGGVPTDITERNNIISSWPDDGSIERLLNPIEDHALSERTRLEDCIIAFITKHELMV